MKTLAPVTCQAQGDHANPKNKVNIDVLVNGNHSYHKKIDVLVFVQIIMVLILIFYSHDT